MHPLRIWMIVVTVVVTVAGFIAPLEARQPQGNSDCVDKFNACSRRCAGRYKDFLPCITRTCDRQYKNCVASTPVNSTRAPQPRGGGVLAPTAAEPTIDQSHVRPPTGGILSTTPGLNSQGPAATGSPAAAPMATPPPPPPPIIIR